MTHDEREHQREIINSGLPLDERRATCLASKVKEFNLLSGRPLDAQPPWPFVGAPAPRLPSPVPSYQ